MRRVLLALTAFAAALSAAQTITIRDAFGRDMTKQGVVLLDWDGYMANPAIRLSIDIEPKNEPRAIDIRSNCTRLIFDRAGDISNGPLGKSMRIQPGETKAEFWVSIFPDRDGKDEDWEIEMRLRGDKEWTPLKVRVVDQDKPVPSTFQITTDFSQDRTRFLKDKTVQSVIKQAAADWAFFIGDMKLDPVAKGSEKTGIWTPEGFVKTYDVDNANPYTGFLLYFAGINGPQLRSGGAPSYSGKMQTSRGKELPLRRSGAVEVEVQGSYTKYGWYIDDSDGNWWVSGSQATEPADLYSIMLHEMGHAIGFETSYPLFGDAQRTGRFGDSRVREYLGDDPPIDVYCHIDRCIDPASGFGVFGAEFQPKMKVRRWLITKAHLLLMQAVGYPIRAVSCFEALAIPRPFITAKIGKKVSGLPLVSGGVPAYQCAITKGKLPEGLSLNGFDGRLSGMPMVAGKYEVSLSVVDQSPNPRAVEKALTIEVAQ